MYSLSYSLNFPELIIGTRNVGKTVPNNPKNAAGEGRFPLLKVLID